MGVFDFGPRYYSPDEAQAALDEIANHAEKHKLTDTPVDVKEQALAKAHKSYAKTQLVLESASPKLGSMFKNRA
jgi:hypothetical protein